MVIDTSAVLAIVLNEPGHATFIDAMVNADSLKMSAATFFESRLVMLRKSGPDQESELLSLLARLKINIAPFDRAQAELAADAYRRYGKGRAAAALNFGDCFSYALAKSLSEPLLYKGGDFARTDVAAAI